MDWSKAKNILIIAFIFTNIFLAYNMQKGIYKGSEIQISNAEYLANVGQHLKDNGINLEVNISEEVISLPILVVQYTNFDSDEMANRFLGEDYKKETEIVGAQNLKREIFNKGSKELTIEGSKRLTYKNMDNEKQDYILNEENVIKISDDFLKEYKLMRDNIVVSQIYYGTEEHIDSKPLYKLIYNQTYKDKFLGESYIHVYINQKGVVAVEAMLLEYKKTQQQRKRIIPASEALMRAMSTILQENEKPINIKEVEVGYYFSPTDYTKSDWKDIDSGTAFPSWKITIQNGRTYFVEAYKN